MARLFAELLGSAFLAAVVVGSGIAAQRLSPGAIGLELLENAAATAAGLFAIILMFGPVSGGHFNPVVSFVDAAFGGLRWRDAAALPARAGGRVHRRRGAGQPDVRPPAVSISAKHRASPAHFLSEVVATLGLIAGDLRAGPVGPVPVRRRPRSARISARRTSSPPPPASPTRRSPSGRMFSDTFAGIAPSSVPAFIGAQVIGGALAVAVIRALYPRLTPAEAADIIVPTTRWAEPAPGGAAGDGASPAACAARGPGQPRPVQPTRDEEPAMHLIAIGGSDAGISAALRARELDPGADVTVVVADAYPNFSICGIPYYVSGEVTALAQPGPPQHRRPGSDRHAAAAGHHRAPHRRRRPASSW